MNSLNKQETERFYLFEDCEYSLEFIGVASEEEAAVFNLIISHDSMVDMLMELMRRFSNNNLEAFLYITRNPDDVIMFHTIIDSKGDIKLILFGASEDKGTCVTFDVDIDAKEKIELAVKMGEFLQNTKIVENLGDNVKVEFNPICSEWLRLAANKIKSAQIG